MSTHEDTREKPLDPAISPTEARKDSIDGQTLKEQLAETNLSGAHTDQHHGESTKAPQEERNIGQHNGAGRPPRMEK